MNAEDLNVWMLESHFDSPRRNDGMDVSWMKMSRNSD